MVSQVPGTLPSETSGSLASKWSSVPVNKVVVYGLQPSSAKEEFEKKKKKKKAAAQNCDLLALECEQSDSWICGTDANMMSFC